MVLVRNQQSIFVSGHEPAIHLDSWPRTRNPIWPPTTHQEFALVPGQNQQSTLVPGQEPATHFVPGPEAGNPTHFTHFPSCAEAGMHRPGCIQQFGTMGFLILPPALATASPSQHTTGTIEGKGCRDLTLDRATTKSGTRRGPKKEKFFRSGSGKKWEWKGGPQIN